MYGKMRKLITYLFFVCGFGCGGMLHAQNAFRKAADKLYANDDYAEAANMYVAILQEQYDEDANARLADCYYKMHKPELAEYWYGVLVQQEPDNSDALKQYAALLKENGKYTSAKTWYLQYARFNADGFYLAGTCDWAVAHDTVQENYAIDTLPFNTPGSEITPAFFGAGILFASTGNKKVTDAKAPQTGLPFYDLYRIDGDPATGTPYPLEGHVNSRYHEASPCYSEKSHILYFTRNAGVKSRVNSARDGNVHLEIFTSYYSDGKFGNPKKFPRDNKAYSVGQPALSPDGSILIFASDMPGGFGGTDLYYCRKTAKGWTAPQNLGPVINTKGNEMFPYMDTNGTLYFSSDWLPGYGGLDIFMSVREGDRWSAPVNMGLPVNSYRDDFGFIFRNGCGYFSSDRPGGKGSDDIYSVCAMQPITRLYIYDPYGSPVAGARITSTESPKQQVLATSDSAGYCVLPENALTAKGIVIARDGFLSYTIRDFADLRSSNGILPVALQALMGDTEHVPEDDSTQNPPDQGEDTVVSRMDSVWSPQELMPEDSGHVYSYDLQIGKFKSPDYGKIAQLARFGELSVQSQNDGSILFLVKDIATQDDAQEARNAALRSGFGEAYIIEYMDGERQN